MATIDTGSRIRQEARNLFMQYGIRSVSMDDIAKKLGISKKTIYLYYTDKDDLVDEVVGAIIEQNESNCNANKKLSKNAIHQVFLDMEMVMEMFKTMNPSVLFDMQKYHSSAFQKFYTHKNEYLFSAIRENIIRGIKEELYRSNIHINILSRFRVESIILPFNPEFYTKAKDNLAIIEEELTIHFLFGLVSSKGYKLILKYQQDRTKKNEKNTAK